MEIDGNVLRVVGELALPVCAVLSVDGILAGALVAAAGHVPVLTGDADAVDRARLVHEGRLPGWLVVGGLARYDALPTHGLFQEDMAGMSSKRMTGQGSRK